MANTFTLNLSSSVEAQVASGAAFPVLSTQVSLSPSRQSYTAGTSAGNVDQLYTAQITATTSGASIQLNGGGLVDPIGGTFAPVRITSIGLYNAGTANVNVTGTFITGAFGASTSLPVHPSGRAVVDLPSTAGLTVSAGTNATMVFTSASGTAPINVLLAGRSV